MSLLSLILFLAVLPLPLLAAITVMERCRMPVREARTNRGVSGR
jgi:hypothetical protein